MTGLLSERIVGNHGPYTRFRAAGVAIGSWLREKAAQLKSLSPVGFIPSSDREVLMCITYF
jgi:hypothetical protein